MLASVSKIKNSYLSSGLLMCFLNLYLLQWFYPQYLKFTQRFRCLSDKDLKTCYFIARKSKNSFSFSQKANYAGITLSLFVDVSNNIPTSIRPACRDYHWTFLLITTEMIKVWVYYLYPCRNTDCWYKLKNTLRVNRGWSFLGAQFKVPSNARLDIAEGNFPPLLTGTDLWGVWNSSGGAEAPAYLLDFGLQVPQLHALLQVLAVLLGGHVQLLLLLVEELQQVLHTSRHVYVSVTKQLNTCNQRDVYKLLTSLPKTNSCFPLVYICFSSFFSIFNLILGAFA